MTIQERIVLLDDAGASIGEADKLASHHESTPLHLAFSGYLFNDLGEFLLTRRAFAKRSFPGSWTNSCCGHPAPGERLITAVRRRVVFELGAVPTALRVVVPAVRYRAADAHGIVENEIGPIVVGRVATAIEPRREEVAELRWVEWTELLDEIDNGLVVSPWMMVTLDALRPLGRPDTWATTPTYALPPALRSIDHSHG